MELYSVKMSGGVANGAYNLPNFFAIYGACILLTCSNTRKLNKLNTVSLFVGRNFMFLPFQNEG